MKETNQVTDGYTNRNYRPTKEQKRFARLALTTAKDRAINTRYSRSLAEEMIFEKSPPKGVSFSGVVEEALLDSP